MKNVPIITIPLIVLLILGGVIVWNENTSPLPSLTIEGPTTGVSSTSVQIADWKCLEEGEYAEVVNDEKEHVGMIDILIKKKENDELKTFFSLNDIMKTSYHPIEVYKCGIYVLRGFGYDYNKSKVLPGYRNEIVRYDYANHEGNSIQLSGENFQGKPEVYYSYDFRVSPDEKYITLVQGYGGEDNYALVIKDLNTLQDVYVLPYKEAPTQDIGIQTTLAMREWSVDGRYFWGSIDETAYTIRLFRIDMQTKKLDPYDLPGTVMVASPLNTARGLIPYIPGHEFLGIDVFAEEEKEARRAKGIGSELYLYNVFTRESFFVDKTDEPLWYFRMQWLSDTKLQYELPDGAKKVYEVGV